MGDLSDELNWVAKPVDGNINSHLRLNSYKQVNDWSQVK